MFRALKDYNITTRKRSKLYTDNTDRLDNSLILSLSDEEDALEMIANVTRNDDNMTGITGTDTEKKGESTETSNNVNDEDPNAASTDPLVAAILGKLDKKFETLTDNIKSFRNSLEFSQGDVDELKNENRALRNRITQLELEEKRNELQLKTLEDHIERIDTSTRKKNLTLEGIEETPDGKDNFQPLLHQLFNQIGIQRTIDFDTCYRVGQFNRNKCRPIIIVFLRQADRDEVYSRRAQMKKTADFHDVWLNEDLGQNARRVTTMIRLVTKEAQKQGIPHKPAKFSIQIEKKRYDEKNLDELPSPLSPHDMKTVKFDDMIAYQSEHSKFSNFYPCEVKVGKHIYTSVEQAYHHIRARHHRQYITALKILLKRKPREIKQLGEEIEEDTEWKKQKLEIMLKCMTMKFEQNPDLAEALKKTEGYVLVEATPDFFWAARATLSSNVLRKKQWKGRNEQGKLLEIVRDLLVQKDEESKSGDT